MGRACSCSKAPVAHSVQPTGCIADAPISRRSPVNPPIKPRRTSAHQALTGTCTPSCTPTRNKASPSPIVRLQPTCKFDGRCASSTLKWHCTSNATVIDRNARLPHGTADAIPHGVPPGRWSVLADVAAAASDRQWRSAAAGGVARSSCGPGTSPASRSATWWPLPCSALPASAPGRARMRAPQRSPRLISCRCAQPVPMPPLLPITHPPPGATAHWMPLPVVPVHFQPSLVCSSTCCSSAPY